jgi:hypothetical protein
VHRIPLDRRSRLSLRQQFVPPAIKAPPGRADNNIMLATRSLLWLIGTLAVAATLWMTLLSGGGNHAGVVPQATTAPSGVTAGAGSAGSYGNAIGAARSATEQTNQDAQRAAGYSAGSP